MKNIKTFILVYIALKSFLAVFYNVGIVGGFNILELGGFIFPVLLLAHRAKMNIENVTNNFERLYLFVIIWLFAVTVMKVFSYSVSWILTLSVFFRVLNGFAVFAVFPLIFKDRKSIDDLVNAFLISTMFPLLQGLIQLLAGADIGGMRTSGDSGMYYGLYYKYDGYAWAALCGGLIMIYKMGIKTGIDRKRDFIYCILFILYLILASMTLSRTLVFNMLVICVVLAITIRATNVGFLLIVAVLIASTLTISGSSYVKDRYDKIMDRSEKEFQVVSGETNVNFAFHGRMGLWKYKLEEFNQRTFIERLTGTEIGTGPHGDYIQWLLQYGYIGIILYIVLFPGMLVCSIRMLFRTNDSHLRPYGFMVVTGLIVWSMGAIMYNSSQMPDYSYFIIGNAAIFLSASKNMLSPKSSSLSTLEPL